MIALLTDFGTKDYFVGAMKGVILSINAEACIVDITHEIPSFDIEAGAFTLLAAYRTFPTKTIHVAIVDPGVGSERRPIVISSDDYFFVGPDNGLFSYVVDREETVDVYQLNNDDYFRPPVSSTFHGRDIFAPVAGALSNGIDPSTLGPKITDYKRLQPLAPNVSADGIVDARIIHIDHFGNCITNIAQDEFMDQMIANGCTLQMGNHQITRFRQYFSEVDTGSSEIFGVWGSAGFLEIAALRASASKLLSVERGQRVIVTGSK